MFTELDEYNKVTADDVLRVAKTYLVENSAPSPTRTRRQKNGRGAK